MKKTYTVLLNERQNIPFPRTGWKKNKNTWNDVTKVSIKWAMILNFFTFLCAFVLFLCFVRREEAAKGSKGECVPSKCQRFQYIIEFFPFVRSYHTKHRSVSLFHLSFHLVMFDRTAGTKCEYVLNEKCSLHGCFILWKWCICFLSLSCCCSFSIFILFHFLCTRAYANTTAHALFCDSQFLFRFLW